MNPRELTVRSIKTCLAQIWTCLWRTATEYWRELIGVIVVLCLAHELYFSLHIAVQDIGFLFGWLIGASKSPTVASVAPVIFGLLGVVVFASIAAILGTASRVVGDRRQDGEPRTRRAILVLILNLLAVYVISHYASWFIYHASLGIDRGTEVREEALQEQASLPAPQQAD